jgi:hypothetical protein
MLVGGSPRPRCRFHTTFRMGTTVNPALRRTSALAINCKRVWKGYELKPRSRTVLACSRQGRVHSHLNHRRKCSWMNVPIIVKWRNRSGRHVSENWHRPLHETSIIITVIIGIPAVGPTGVNNRLDVVVVQVDVA